MACCFNILYTKLIFKPIILKIKQEFLSFYNIYSTVTDWNLFVLEAALVLNRGSNIKTLLQH